MSASLAFLILGQLGAPADAPSTPSAGQPETHTTNPATTTSSAPPPTPANAQPAPRVVEPPSTVAPRSPPLTSEVPSYESITPPRALPNRPLTEEEQEAEEERLEEEREREEEARDRIEDEKNAKTRTVGPFFRLGGTFGSQGFDSEAVGVHEGDGVATRFRTGGQMAVTSYGGRGELGVALGFRNNSFAIIPRVSFEAAYGEEIRRQVSVAQIDHGFRLRPQYFAGAAGVEFQFAQRIAHASIELGLGGTTFEVNPIAPTTNFSVEVETRSSMKARAAFGGQVDITEGFALNFEGAAQFYFPTYYHGAGTLLNIGMGFEFDGSRIPKQEGR